MVVNELILRAQPEGEVCLLKTFIDLCSCSNI